MMEAIDIVEMYLDQEADFLAENCEEDCVDDEREQLAAIRTVLTVAKRIVNPDDEVRWILGRPCFWCGSIAEALRRNGHDIPTKAEDEQASVIHWMLSMYLKHGDKWREFAHHFLVEGRDHSSSCLT
jgi:hypothetical protein